jgi:hypothetical protein
MAGVGNPRSRPMTPFQERLGRVAVQWMTGINNVAYRLSGGRVAGHLPGGAPVCLLTTTGRHTNLRRTVPLLCLRDGADLVVVASRGGIVQLGPAEIPVRARDATEEERNRLWPALTAIYEHFDAYQARTARQIPLVILSPA